MLVKGAAFIVTQDSRREVLKGADVLVEGNKISEVGRITGKAGAEFVIDGKGKLVMPGMVNAHTHLGMTLLRGCADDLRLDEWLAAVRAVESGFKEPQIYWGSMLGCIEMIRSGTTAFADMYFHMNETAKAVKECGLRANLCYGMVDFGDEKKRKSELAEGERFFGEWNGKAEGRVTCSFGPHSVYLCSKELLLKSAEIARKKKAKIQIHVSETRKEVLEAKKKLGKRPVEYLFDLGFLGSDVIASHGVWITKSEIALLSKSGTHVVHCPVSNLKLASGESSPTTEIIDAGGRLALGTDGAASNNSLNMIETMKVAALIEKGSRWDATALGAQKAVDAATTNGSAALGINSGSIEEGRLADFVLLDLKNANMAPVRSPISNIVYSSNPANVCDVIVNGKPLVLNGKLLNLDEEKIVEKATEEAFKRA